MGLWLKIKEWLGVSSKQTKQKRRKSMALFTVHKLNAEGLNKAAAIQDAFEELESELKDITALTETMNNANKCFALTITKLEEACMWAKKAVALQKKYQVRE